MTPEQTKDAATQAVSASPSLAAIVVWVIGIPLEKWAAVVGILFIVVQMAYFLWKWRRDIRREDERIQRGIAPPATDRGAL